VALVNSLLNRYNLGEFGAVIDECRRTLIMSASFRKEVQEYWNILNMPLGICYYEMNKPSLAIEYLKKAKHFIDKMNLFHMHGIIELYLFRSCYLLNDRAGMEEIKAQASADFENMHYTYTDLIICMFRILCYRLDGGQNLQPDIERFEIEFIKGKGTNQFLLLETLCYLKINGLSEVITIDDIIKSLERFRFTGMIPYTQTLLILLAEMYYMENRKENAAECLVEAVTIYREYGISASFYLYPLKSSVLLEKIEPRIYRVISKKGILDKLPVHGQILSAREKEIMQLIALGKSNKEISEVLYIGIGTIKWHINHIFSKLETENRVQAIQKAKSLGEIL
jgi:LuxR family maltose regulon positive regulatory protein